MQKKLLEKAVVIAIQCQKRLCYCICR